MNLVTWSMHWFCGLDGRGPDGARRRSGTRIATHLRVLQMRDHPLPWPAGTVTPV